MWITGKKLNMTKNNRKVVTAVVVRNGVLVKEEIYVSTRPYRKNLINNKRRNLG
jgi:hypothetical protein